MKPIAYKLDKESMMAAFQERDDMPRMCPDCGGTGWKQAERDGVSGVVSCGCAVRARARARAARALDGLDSRYHAANLDEFSPLGEEQRVAMEVIIEDPLDSYRIVGRVNHGKTYLMAAQFRAVMEAGIPAHFRTTRQLIGELQAQETEDHKPSEVWEAIQTEDEYHLFLDDFDKVNFQRSQFRAEMFFSLIDKLYTRQLGLTFTSNKTLRQMYDNDMLTVEIGRRLNEITTKIDL